MQVTYALASMIDSERRQAYAEGAVVYATAQTLAFDYLRDSSCHTPESLLLPDKFGHVIIDEVDQVLIDNAIQPNITSGPDDRQTDVIFDRIEKATAVAQGLVAKQLGITVGAQNQNTALLQHLGTVLGGLGVDVNDCTAPGLVNDVYKELSYLARSALGHLPASLCAPSLWYACGMPVVCLWYACAQGQSLLVRPAASSESVTVCMCCRDLFEYDGETRRVKVTKLGFACAAHQLAELWQVSKEDWVEQMWAAYISKALDAALVYVPGVDYAVTQNPTTGKQDVLLIDQSTSAIPDIPPA